MLKRLTRIILAILLTFGLFYLICQKVSFRDVFEVILSIPVTYIIPIFAFFIAAVGFKCFKWCYLVEKTISPAPSRISVIKSFFAGLSVGIVTPGRAGELARALYIEGEGKLKLSSLVIIDKAFDLIGVAILALPGAFYFLGASKALLLLGIIFFGIGFLLLQSRLPSLFGKIKVLNYLSNNLQNFISSFSSLKPRLIFNMLILSLVCFLTLMIEFYLLIQAVQPIDLHNVFLGQPLVVLTNAIPTMAGGLGVRFGAAAVIFNKFGISEAVAVNAALITFFLNSGIPALIGLFFVSGVKMGEKASVIEAQVVNQGPEAREGT